MIRVHRGAEPPELTAERERRLAELRLAWLDAGVDPTDPASVAAFASTRSPSLDLGYRDAAAEVLLHRLHHKCAYCEAEVHLADEVDHFRPRRPQKNGTTLVHPGYFWLTWSWDNLLFTCSTCHGPKKNAFAIDGVRLEPWGVDTAAEQARLIDPSREDPTSLLEFRRDDDGHWVVHGAAGRPADTVAAFALGVNKDRYRGHLRTLDLLIDELEGVADDPSERERQWRRLVHHYIGDADARFRAVSRAHIADRLTTLIALHGWVLPSLADTAPVPDPVGLFPPRPGVDSQPERLEMAIRALNPGYRTTEARERVLREWVAAGGDDLDTLLQVAPSVAQTPAERRWAADGLAALAGT